MAAVLKCFPVRVHRSGRASVGDVQVALDIVTTRGEERIVSIFAVLKES